MAGAPCCAPHPAPPLIRSAAPLASPCRPSFRNCLAQKPPPDYPNLWCLNRRKAATALRLFIILPSGGKVGFETADVSIWAWLMSVFRGGLIHVPSVSD